MFATHSDEAKIIKQLDELGCSGTAFADISQVCGRNKMAECLSGRKRFEQSELQRMLACLADMTELRDMSQATLDWTNTLEIREALETRRKTKKLLVDVERIVVELRSLYGTK